VPGERCGGQIDEIGTLLKADGPQGSPMYGDGTQCVSAVRRLRRLLGIEMALTQGGSPASNGKQGDVDVHDLLIREIRSCVPRVPAPEGALDEKSERGSAMRACRVAPAIVVGGQNVYSQAAKLDVVTGLDLAERQTAGRYWPEQTARADWGNENRGGRDASERGQVGVVGV
jgi:hypothetical protein